MVRFVGYVIVYSSSLDMVNTERWIILIFVFWKKKLKNKILSGCESLTHTPRWVMSGYPSLADACPSLNAILFDTPGSSPLALSILKSVKRMTKNNRSFLDGERWKWWRCRHMLRLRVRDMFAWRSARMN